MNNNVLMNLTAQSKGSYGSYTSHMADYRSKGWAESMLNRQKTWFSWPARWFRTWTWKIRRMFSSAVILGWRKQVLNGLKWIRTFLDARTQPPMFQRFVSYTSHMADKWSKGRPESMQNLRKHDLAALHGDFGLKCGPQHRKDERIFHRWWF